MPRRTVLISTNRRVLAGTVVDSLRELDGVDAAVVAPGAATLSAVLRHRPDLVLVDADHVHGCRTVMRLIGPSTSSDVVVLADDGDSPQVDACLLAGATDVLEWGRAGSLPAAIEHRLDGVPATDPGTILGRRRRALAALAGDSRSLVQPAGSQR